MREVRDTAAPFPGAVGVSHLRVYNTVAPDGIAGGTPHFHTTCTEAYAVIAGTGAVQTITREGFRVVDLHPGSFVWFTPGTIHRLVNYGDLEILVIMQNAGLPEAGDMIITFDPATRASAAAYVTAAQLPEDEQTTSGSGDAAARRRDAAVRWFVELRAAVERRDFTLLDALYADAARLVAHRLDAWRDVWRDGPLAATAGTGELLDALGRGDASHLRDAAVFQLPPPAAERRLGCCGTLGTYVPPHGAVRGRSG